MVLDIFERATQAPLAAYQDGLRRGRLMYQYSLAAERPFFPPRIVCPYSATDRFEWRESSGRGTVYSVSSVQSRGKPSYAVALVDVDEGFRMLSRIQHATGEDVAIDARVRLVVGAGDEGEPVAFFELDRTS